MDLDRFRRDGHTSPSSKRRSLRGPWRQKLPATSGQWWKRTSGRGIDLDRFASCWHTVIEDLVQDFHGRPGGGTENIADQPLELTLNVISFHTTESTTLVYLNITRKCISGSVSVATGPILIVSHCS